MALTAQLCSWVLQLQALLALLCLLPEYSHLPSSDQNCISSTCLQQAPTFSLFPPLRRLIPQGFRNREEVQRFADMMEEMCYLVATKNSGSLKGEHGTGRNMAPFVEMEWGTKVSRSKRRLIGCWSAAPSTLLSDCLGSSARVHQCI